jgi:hypothetical protein
MVTSEEGPSTPRNLEKQKKKKKTEETEEECYIYTQFFPSSHLTEVLGEKQKRSKSPEERHENNPLTSRSWHPHP